MGVTTIDDDIARLEMRDELLDEGVNCRTSLDEKDDFARALELGTELLDRPCALDLGAYIANMRNRVNSRLRAERLSG